MDTGRAVPAATPRLAAKLATIMGAVSRVAKDGRNTFHNYDYATEAAVAAAVRGAMAEQLVSITPSIDNYEIRELQGDKSKQRLLFIIKMTFTVRDGESDEMFTLSWLGTGEDASDKGLYKAITGAEKYLLLKLFMIPTGDDPERDEAPRQAPPRQARAATPRHSARTADETITDEMVQRLKGIIAQSEVDERTAGRNLRDRFGITRYRDILRKDYDTVIDFVQRGFVTDVRPVVVPTSDEIFNKK